MPGKAPQGVYPCAGPKGPHCKATGEFRPPLKGEIYLSGAAGWVALNDLSTPFWIAEPVELVKCQCCKGTGRVVTGGSDPIGLLDRATCFVAHAAVYSREAQDLADEIYTYQKEREAR